MEIDDVRAAIAAEVSRTREQITTLERSFDAIVGAAELTSTDDEHDPEGSTIAYERQQVAALIASARAHLEALQQVEVSAALTCTVCAGPIAVERALALPGVPTCIRCATGRGHAPRTTSSRRGRGG